MSAEAVEHSTVDAEKVEALLSAFERAIRDKDRQALSRQLVEDSYWRDILALSWGVHTYFGRDQILDFLDSVELRPATLQLDCTSPPRRVSRSGTDCIEAIFNFQTQIGSGRGVLRFLEHEDRIRIWTIATSLQQFREFPEAIGENRPTGTEFSRTFSGPNWLEKRVAAQEYRDSDPTVLIVGGGQAGLTVAARLRQLGVDALIVDRMKRIGDNWRTRYHSLALHNEVWVTHLPYMPFPESWPTYVPKDKLANFFESYVDAMELNFWTETNFIGAEYDERNQCWSARLRLRDGTERLMRPDHIVMAVGVSGGPKYPTLPGLDEFHGQVIPSESFTDGSSYRGKRVAVVGTGTSGHDVAQDLYSNGADVTMIQRSKTTVTNVGPKYAGRVYALYGEGRSLDDCDLITTSTPYPLVRRGYQLITRGLANDEKDLLEGLRSVGFEIDFGEDDTGFQMKYLERGGGYYLNVGCSELLIEGQIGLLHFANIARFIDVGILLTDGESLEFDAIVLATGFKGQDTVIRKLFGEEVNAAVGPVWGFGENGELRNMWRPTGQPGLWFTAGSLTQCRIYSKFLAMQIKALEEGLVTFRRLRDSPTGSIRDRDRLDVRESAHVRT